MPFLSARNRGSGHSRFGRIVGDLVGGSFAMDQLNGLDWYWSSGLRYQNFNTRPDNEFASYDTASMIRRAQSDKI